MPSGKYVRTPKIRKKQSDVMKGRKLTEEHKRKIGKAQSKRTLKIRKMKLHINPLEFAIILFGIIGWSFLAYFILMAYFYGGSTGAVTLHWNTYDEMMAELFLIFSIITIMALYLFIKVFGIKRKKRKR